jgi:UDP:flavonoid glycosyltransferase YjiC (YdhE family)
LAHGGLLGTIEAVHVGVPMIGIPMYGDQFTNMKMVEAAGMGITLLYPDITKDNILKALRTVLDNSRCNTEIFLRTYSVILFYSRVNIGINTDMKNGNGNAIV